MSKVNGVHRADGSQHQSGVATPATILGTQFEDVGPRLEDQEHEREQTHLSGIEDQYEKAQGLTVFLLIVRNFSTIWFTISMDTGVLSIIMHQLPGQFSGLPVLSTVMFVLNLVLFIAISSIWLLRWILYPSETFHAVFNDTEEVALLACPTIAYFTLVGQVALTCSNSWGHGFTILAYVLWWIGVVWILLVVTMLYIHMIRKPSGQLVDRWLPTAVFVPIVGTMTAGTIGGVIINNADHVSAGLAVPVIIVGLMLVGFGWLLGILVYSVFFHRLLTAGWPPAEKIPGLILTIGPCGQAASALQLLGTAADQGGFFAEYNQGTFLQGPAGAALHTACILLALLLLGFAVFWICVAYFAIINGLWHKSIPPSMVWWSTIFPMGTVVTAFLTLSTEMDSSAFRGLTAGLLVFLLINYFINAAFTIPMTFSGKMFGIRRTHPFLHGVPSGPGWSALPHRAAVH